jgi:hypothetical protein
MPSIEYLAAVIADAPATMSHPLVRSGDPAVRDELQRNENTTIGRQVTEIGETTALRPACRAVD